MRNDLIIATLVVPNVQYCARVRVRCPYILLNGNKADLADLQKLFFTSEWHRPEKLEGG